MRSGLKEKCVSIYEDFFAGRSPIAAARERGIQGQSTIQRFWDELFLLKVNQDFLAQCISSRSEDQLKQIAKPVMNELFSACVSYLSDGSFIRVAHALETLVVALREIFRKRFSQQGLTITMLVSGSVDNADPFFRRLLSSTSILLGRDDVPIVIKSLGLRLYLTILTATDNVNSNPIASYFFTNNIFDALVAVLSLKVTSDRKRLELDATLTLLVLLLWRESQNTYIGKLSSPLTPLACLLNTVDSLLSPPSAPKKAAAADEQIPGWEDVVGYISTLFGLATVDQVNGRSTTEDCQSSCRRSCGLALLYHLVYLHPSNLVWPATADDGHEHALTGVWINVLKNFISVCHEHFLNVAAMQKAGGGIPQAKLALTVFRCMLENPVALNYLSYSDADFSLRKSSSGSRLAIPTSVIPYKTISCVLVELACNVLESPLVDPDLHYRAAAVVPLMLKHVKAQALQLLASSLNANRLWQALIGCCTECIKGANFHKPGVPELAELASGILEWCLTSSPDVFFSSEDTEALHAQVMCSARALERLHEELLASSIGGGSLPNKSLVNTMAVKHHYEIQIGSKGVREEPSFEQAVVGVRTKGTAGLKFKAKHAGPRRLYSEGTNDLRVLGSLVKLVVNAQRKLSSAIPKLENNEDFRRLS